MKKQISFADKQSNLTKAMTTVIIDTKRGIKEEKMILPKYYNANCIYLYCIVDRDIARRMTCEQVPLPIKLYETPKIAYEATKNATIPHRVILRMGVNVNAGIIHDEFGEKQKNQDKATLLKVYNKELRVIEYEIRRIEHVVISSISIIR